MNNNIEWFCLVLTVLLSMVLPPSEILDNHKYKQILNNVKTCNTIVIKFT